jgi:hypothetical protein
MECFFAAVQYYRAYGLQSAILQLVGQMGAGLHMSIAWATGAGNEARVI